MSKLSKYQKVVILNNIRSLYNVGAIFRTCEATGVNYLYLCGTTGHPDISTRVNKQIAKTALGNIEKVPWKYYKNITFLLNKLKKENFNLISIEQNKESEDYKKYKLKNNTAFIFGNEVEGVEKKVLNKSDTILELPMMGKTISINVATSVGVILYHFLN